MDYTDCNDFLWPIDIFGFNPESISYLQDVNNYRFNH
jgi:hypothetical protein